MPKTKTKSGLTQNQNFIPKISINFYFPIKFVESIQILNSFVDPRPDLYHKCFFHSLTIRAFHNWGTISSYRLGTRHPHIHRHWHRHTLTHIYICRHTLSFPISNTQIHTHKHASSLTHTNLQTHTHTFSLSLCHTHTYTYTHTHNQTKHSLTDKDS